MQSRELEKIAAHYKVKIEPQHLVMRKIKSRIKGFEKKYNCSSESMWLAISQNPMLETEETCHWMQDYIFLKIASGIDTTGTHTKTTSKSMIPV